MVNQNPQFEMIDNEGSTIQIAGTVGTTPIQVPSVATFDISEILIRCATDNSPITKRLLWSLDNVTYHTLGPGEYVGWTLKGQQTQIWLKGNVAGVDYEVLVNREAA